MLLEKEKRQEKRGEVAGIPTETWEVVNKRVLEGGCIARLRLDGSSMGWLPKRKV